VHHYTFFQYLAGTKLESFVDSAAKRGGKIPPNTPAVS
jgi:hypothetical protein